MKDVKYCLTFAHDPATFHTVGNAGEEGRRRSDGDPTAIFKDLQNELKKRNALY